MCTVVLLRRPTHAWPLILGANRDEMGDRPWLPPARHWPDRPRVVAGLDRLAGGTWLGINNHGVAAMVLNRRGSLGPRPGVRSRGELPLLALDHADARTAALALADLNPAAYRSFNLIVADHHDAFWLCSRYDQVTRGHQPPVEVHTLPSGVSMITASDRNDRASDRIRTFLPRFEVAVPPDPEADDWRSWTSLLESRVHDVEAGPEGAMTIVTDRGFGTLCSSLVALGQPTGGKARIVWRFAAGRPGETPFKPVTI
ncbi:MAG: NRDE family protein [Rhodospirillales bacterium]|nr:NRDE family protein [Rhodospirillales bacterium]